MMPATDMPDLGTVVEFYVPTSPRALALSVDGVVTEIVCPGNCPRVPMSGRPVPAKHYRFVIATATGRYIRRADQMKVLFP